MGNFPTMGPWGTPPRRPLHPDVGGSGGPMNRKTNIASVTKIGAGPNPCRCNIIGGKTIWDRSECPGKDSYE